MPEAMIREITNQYVRKGKSRKQAKSIAYAIATKQGWRRGHEKAHARKKALGW